jgi:hypothetical protein
MKRTINANKKAIRLPLWLKNGKAMGPDRSPMAHCPVIGMASTGDPYQNKNKSS